MSRAIREKEGIFEGQNFGLKTDDIKVASPDKFPLSKTNVVLGSQRDFDFEIDKWMSNGNINPISIVLIF